MTAMTQSQGIPEGIEVKPRRMKFDLLTGERKRYSIEDNPILTTLFFALSSVFPEGERHFIQAVRAFQGEITDPILKDQVRGFIGQEAHHGNSHEEFNNLIEKQLGYPMAFISNKAKNGLAMFRARVGRKTSLAHTIALEHFTAILANQFLLDKDLIDTESTDLKEMLVWHAIEETEHKAVAYDVYQAIDGGYFRRVLVMMITTFTFMFGISLLQMRMMIRDRYIPRPKHFVGAFRFFFLDKPGFIRKIAGDYFDYFKPSFHPWDHDNSHLIRGWEDNQFNYIARRVVTS